VIFVKRRFNPEETLHIPKGSYSPPLDKNVKRSLYDLFLGVLSSLENTEPRISTKPGSVWLSDEYHSYSVTWILNVVDSIYMAVSGDPHISIRAIAFTKSGNPYTSRVACVFMGGEEPVGDYLAHVLLMFHNNIMVDQIHTLEEIRREALRSVMRAEKAEEKEAKRETFRQQEIEAIRRRNEERAARIVEREKREYELVEGGIPHLLDEDGRIWTKFYSNVIAVEVSHRIRKHILGELDLFSSEEFSNTIDRLYEVDCDSTPTFPSYERERLLHGLIEAPVSPSTRINIINRLGDNENNALHHLDYLRVDLESGISWQEDPDGLLLNATLDAIDRIRGQHYERMFASARRRR